MKKTNHVIFSLIGGFSNEFLSKIMTDGIKIYDVENKDGVIYGKCSASNYRKMAKQTRKYRVRMRIVKKEGVYFKVLPYKKRYGIILGILAYMSIITLFSGVVWDIDISGNTKVTDELILETLAQNGIKGGVSVKQVETAMTEVKSLLALDRLAWISIERQGSRIVVKVSEQLDKIEHEIPLDVSCNIIASHSGQIISASVYSGTLLYPVGSGVKEGNVIVSGVVDDGGGNLLYNHANAEIIAEYTEQKSFFMPYTTTETVKNGIINETEYLQLYSFIFPQDEISYISGNIYSTENHAVFLFGVKMPWTIRKIISEGTEKITVTRKTTELKKLLEASMNNYELNFYSDAEIVKKEEVFAADETGVTLTVDYTIRKDIAQKKEFYLN